MAEQVIPRSMQAKLFGMLIHRAIRIEKMVELLSVKTVGYSLHYASWINIFRIGVRE